MTDGLLETVTTRFGSMAIFAKDTGSAGASLRRYGEWAYNELSFMERFVSPGATVIDAGAYIGTHTLAFASFFGPQGKVIAIEAQPASFDVLAANVASNGLAHVKLENAIALDKLGDSRIEMLDPTRDGSFGSTQVHDVSQAVADTTAATPAMPIREIRGITIDSLNLDSCALLKIDAEGMEHQILKGARQMLARCGPVVYAEVNSIEEGAKTWAILREAGYVSYLHVVDAFNPQNYLQSARNIFGNGREVAFVAVPAGQQDRLSTIVPRPCELVLEVMTFDDIALAMLNKPQYPAEVLEHTAAAKSGGQAWLNQLRHLHRADQLRDDVRDKQAEIDGLRKLVRAVKAERERLERALEAADARSAHLQSTYAMALSRHARAEIEILSLGEELIRMKARAEETLAIATRETGDLKALAEAALRQATGVRDHTNGSVRS